MCNDSSLVIHEWRRDWMHRWIIPVNEIGGVSAGWIEYSDPFLWKLRNFAHLLKEPSGSQETQTNIDEIKEPRNRYQIVFVIWVCLASYPSRVCCRDRRSHWNKLHAGRASFRMSLITTWSNSLPVRLHPSLLPPTTTSLVISQSQTT